MIVGNSLCRSLSKKLYKSCSHSLEKSHSLARDGLLPCLGIMKPREPRLKLIILLIPGRNEDFVSWDDFDFGIKYLSVIFVMTAFPHIILH